MDQRLHDSLEIALTAEIGHDDGKFITAESADGIGIPDTSRYAPGGLHQQGVPLGVAEAVIDLLEAVEIDEQNSQWPTASLCSFDLLFQVIVEQVAIGQSGQCIEVRLAPDQLLALLPLRDIREDRDILKDLAVLIVDGFDGQPF